MVFWKPLPTKFQFPKAFILFCSGWERPIASYYGRTQVVALRPWDLSGDAVEVMKLVCLDSVWRRRDWGGGGDPCLEHVVQARQHTWEMPSDIVGPV